MQYVIVTQISVIFCERILSKILLRTHGREMVCSYTVGLPAAAFLKTGTIIAFNQSCDIGCTKAEVTRRNDRLAPAI